MALSYQHSLETERDQKHPQSEEEENFSLAPEGMKGGSENASEAPGGWAEEHPLLPTTGALKAAPAGCWEPLFPIVLHRRCLCTPFPELGPLPLVL